MVQAVALAHVVDRSLLHHAPLGAVAPAIVLVGLAIVVRVVLHGAGDLSAHGAADRVVSRLARASCCAMRSRSGRAGWPASAPGSSRSPPPAGLRSLHTYYARYLPQAAAAAVIPVLLLAWVATQDWLSFVVVIALVVAVPVTMVLLRARGDQALGSASGAGSGSLAGRFLQLVEGLPTLRAFGREDQGRREVEAATEGVRIATMRTLRVAFLSALSMDMIAGFGVGLRRHGAGSAAALGRAQPADGHGRPARRARRSSSRCAAPAPSSTPAPRARPRRPGCSRCWTPRFPRHAAPWCDRNRAGGTGRHDARTKRGAATL